MDRHSVTLVVATIVPQAGGEGRNCESISDAQRRIFEDAGKNSSTMKHKDDTPYTSQGAGENNDERPLQVDSYKKIRLAMSTYLDGILFQSRAHR